MTLFSQGASQKKGVASKQVGQRVVQEEGVVSVKVLSNKLVAVVYTSGVLRVWSAQTAACIAEYNL